MLYVWCVFFVYMLYIIHIFIAYTWGRRMPAVAQGSYIARGNLTLVLAGGATAPPDPPFKSASGLPKNRPKKTSQKSRPKKNVQKHIIKQQKKNGRKKMARQNPAKKRPKMDKENQHVF